MLKTAWLATEDSDAVPKIAGDPVHDAADSRLAHAFASAKGAAEMTPSLGFGVLAGHPSAPVGIDSSVEVESQLLIELLIERPLAPLIQETADQ